MARVWKRQSDKRRKGAPWMFTYFDHEAGRERSRKGFTDKELTAKLARDTEEQSKARMLGIVDESAEATARAASMPITKHIDAFIETLESRGRSAKRVAEVRGRIERFLGHGHVERLSDVTLVTAAAFAGDPRKGGAGAATVAEYVGALKQFSRWAVESGRMLTDPLRTLGRPPRSSDRRRYKRRALTNEELCRSLDAASRRPPIELRTIRRGERARAQAARLSVKTEARAIVTGN